MTVCSIEGCTKPVDRRGWCTHHYFQWYRYGDPTAAIPHSGVYKIVCKRGHDLSNAYIRPDTRLRQCRECAKERNKTYVRPKVFIRRTVRRRLIQEASGICAYCGQPRATSLDHVIPKRDRRRVGLSDTDESWLVVACLTCNVRKGTRRLVPASWSDRIAELNDLTPGTPWRVWHGSTDEPAYRDVHLKVAP